MATPADVREVNGLAIGTVDTERMCRDVDLAKLLGFKQPRNIRQLIKKHIGGGLGAVVMRTESVRITKAAGKTRAAAVEEREVNEYWLTQLQALWLVAKADTPTAMVMLGEILKRFEVYERGQRQFDRIHLYILDQPDEAWEMVFKHHVTAALSKLYGHKHDPSKGFPLHLLRMVGQLYEAILGSLVTEKMREHKQADRARGLKMHQRLTPEAKKMMIQELHHVERIAQMSGGLDDFKARIETAYKGAPFQLSFSVPALPAAE